MSADEALEEDGGAESPTGISPNEFSTLIGPHCPEHWEPSEEFKKLLRVGHSFQMVVLAADIRRSTLLMKESVDLTEFANTIGAFVSAARSLVRREHGWFDKFTGDGFLAYWLVDAEFFERDDSEPLILRGQEPDALCLSGMRALHASCALIEDFNRVAVPHLRANSRNFPRSDGLSMGIDAGPCNIVDIAGALTIVGPAVVGAVRMVNSATLPDETIMNVYLGEYLQRNRQHLCSVDQMTREYRLSKEFPEGQEIYSVRFCSSNTV